MRDINEVMSKAEAIMDLQVNLVTEHLRKVLIHRGIPEDIAQKYCVEYVHGGEWVLNDDEGELCREDIHLLNNEYITSVIKDIEGL